MPWSYDTFDRPIADLVRWAFPDPRTPILDVGAGAGKYARLLAGYTILDAVEVFAPYVERFHLRRLYRAVHVAGISDFLLEIPPGRYALAILGDVLEHLDVDEAQQVVTRLAELNARMLVVVPFRMEQGASGGNPHEAHRQPDLTPEVMRQRYPELRMLMADRRSGVYLGGPQPLAADAGLRSVRPAARC